MAVDPVIANINLDCRVPGVEPLNEGLTVFVPASPLYTVNAVPDIVIVGFALNSVGILITNKLWFDEFAPVATVLSPPVVLFNL